MILSLREWGGHIFRLRYPLLEEQGSPRSKMLAPLCTLVVACLFRDMWCGLVSVADQKELLSFGVDMCVHDAPSQSTDRTTRLSHIDGPARSAAGFAVTVRRMFRYGTVLRRVVGPAGGRGTTSTDGAALTVPPKLNSLDRPSRARQRRLRPLCLSLATQQRRHQSRISCATLSFY
ncbi:uncharacterized protein C8Q71DRAFT_506540 [Rhodofomes roseus]|uniref:Uncharacterized protein n=1 Tax=Rhodofomes roseus TaxID=34475 RepID=A0ABQ8KM24_9APHY|nr:uncharacterized protein C8Q71DRAFT_506540 [Rhodofomes roseus]KAH9839325.1 hypothetical protein C8Q71DRAFT_506540 [Rhodofomes roseus]